METSMTDEQRSYCERVYTLLKEQNRVFIPPYPTIDLAVAEQMGFSPEEVAAAFVGLNPKVMDAVVARMREDGSYGGLSFQDGGLQPG
jgi:hypothetical protein